MPFQLTISRRDLSPQDALKRKPTILVQGAEATIGGSGTDCQLEGIDGVVARISTLSDGTHAVTADGAVELNGRPCGKAPLPLHSGDRLVAGTWLVQFHLCLEKARLSWQSSFLANFVKGAITVIIILIFGFMFLFTDMLRKSNFWETYATQNQLSQRLDDLRKSVKQVQKGTQLQQLDSLLLEHIRMELDANVRHVRTYESAMSPAQRQDMLHHLERLEGLMERLLANGVFKELPQPAVEQAIAKILTNKPR